MRFFKPKSISVDSRLKNIFSLMVGAVGIFGPSTLIIGSSLWLDYRRPDLFFKKPKPKAELKSKTCSPRLS